MVLIQLLNPTFKTTFHMSKRGQVVRLVSKIRMHELQSNMYYNNVKIIEMRSVLF